MQPGALSNLDIDSAIAEIASGTLTKTLAARYGIPKPTLRDKLLTHPGYATAVKSQAESLVETATAEAFECEPDSAVIARARLRVDAAHKWAAARDPATWGARPELGGLTVNVQVVAFSEGN